MAIVFRIWCRVYAWKEIVQHDMEKWNNDTVACKICTKIHFEQQQQQLQEKDEKKQKHTERVEQMMQRKMLLAQ